MPKTKNLQKQIENKIEKLSKLLDKIIELFGKEIPIVLFVPMGFRLNGKKNGKR